MIEAKQIEINDKKFMISKFPAVSGIEIAVKFVKGVQDGIDWKIIEEILYKGMKYVGVVIDNHPQPLMLTTQSLIDNHIKDWEMLGKLAIALMEYNCSFFPEGRLSTLLSDLAQKAQP